MNSHNRGFSYKNDIYHYMNIKRIIREELDGMEWIKDVKSNQDIAQDIADETYIKDNEIFTPFPPSPLSPSLSTFAHLRFRFHLPSDGFIIYCKEQYGLNDDDIKDVWNRYKKMVMDKVNDHSNLNESDDLEWIRDIKSNQDIAQEIANETKIKDNEIYAPFVGEGSKWYRWLNKEIFLASYRYFHDYCEKHHGLTDVTITHDIWKRYKKMVMDKINDHNNLNENDGMEWIRENPIEVGKCFTVNPTWYKKGVPNAQDAYMVKIIDIKQGEELKGVGGRKLMDIPKGSFNERAVKIKFAKKTYGSWRDDIEIYYPDVQDWVDWGWLTPVECE